MKKEKISIEAEAETVEQAIKKALAQLQVPKSKVKIEILSEETKGLFGMSGGQLAKIRATIIK